MNRRGQTVVEAMVAILLTAIIVTSVFSVALSAKHSGGRADRKIAAAYGSRYLQDRLKNYVARFPTGVPNTDWPGSGPCAPSLCGAGNSWGLPGDAGYAYALAPTGGLPYPCDPATPMPAPFHNANALLPALLRQTPYFMTMRYRVASPVALSNENFQPQVTICVNWQEPP